MSPAPKPSILQPPSTNRRASASELFALAAIPGALLTFGWFPDMAWAGHSALLIVLLARTWLAHDLPKPQKVDHVILAIAAFTMLRFIFGQGDFGTQRFSSVFAGVLLYAGLRTVPSRFLAVRWTLFSLAISGAVLAAYSLLRTGEWIAHVRAAGFSDVTALKARLVSVLRGLVNEWATVLVLLLVLQVAVIRPVRARFFGRNAFALGAMLPVAAALFLTFSRGAYAAAIFFVAAVAVFTTGHCRVTAYARKRLISALLLVMAGSAVAVNQLSGGAVARTVKAGATEQQRRSTAGRFRVWSSSMELATQQWLLGSGPGTFAMRYVPKAGLGEGRSYVGRPLNTALVLLVEEGVVGAALQALLALFIVVPAWRASSRMSGARSYQVRVLVLGCGAFWIREMTFSSLLENRLVMALYWVLLGLIALLVAPARGADRKAGAGSRIALIALAAAAVVTFGVEERWKSAERSAVAAAKAFQDGDIDGAAAAVEQAISTRPMPPYLGLRALIRACDAMPAWDPRHPFQTLHDPGQRKRLQDALLDLDLALSGNPNDDLFWHNRAWIRLRLGSVPEDVIPDIRRAVAIDGGSVSYRVGLGLLLEQQGRTGEAGDQYAAALAAAPDSCDSEFARRLKSRSPLLWEAALSKAIGILRSVIPMTGMCPLVRGWPDCTWSKARKREPAGCWIPSRRSCPSFHGLGPTWGALI